MLQGGERPKRTPAMHNGMLRVLPDVHRAHPEKQVTIRLRVNLRRAAVFRALTGDSIGTRRGIVRRNW